MKPILLTLYSLILSFHIADGQKGETFSSSKRVNPISNIELYSSYSTNLIQKPINNLFHFNEKYVSKRDNDHSMGQTLLTLTAFFFVIGTINAFDKGFDSNGAIGFYSCSLVSGTALYIHINRNNKRRK